MASIAHRSIEPGPDGQASIPFADPARPTGPGAAPVWQVTVDPEQAGPSLTALSALLAAGIDPRQVHWSEPDRPMDLFDVPVPARGGTGTGTGTFTGSGTGNGGRARAGRPDAAAGVIQPAVAAERRPRHSLLTLPGRFPEIARLAAMHSDPDRFPLLHRVAARLRDEPQAGWESLDPAWLHLSRLAREVRLEICRIEAFTRFRVVADVSGSRSSGGSGSRRLAWIEPRHAVLREVAPFFAERFGTRRWSILSPRLSVDWDGTRLRYGPGVDGPGPSMAEARDTTAIAAPHGQRCVRKGSMMPAAA